MPLRYPKTKHAKVTAQKRKAKRANISAVHDEVFVRDFGCRIAGVLWAFGFRLERGLGTLELAHLKARGIGGNPDLSRDTTKNLICTWGGLHQGPRSMHSGHIQVRPLTKDGADGPVCVEFYEQLPTEAK